MPDHIDRYTDQQEAAYARKIADTYKQAAQEVRRQITEFTAKHKAKAAKLLQQVNAGEISMADYQAWLQGQVFIGKQWQDKLDDIVRVYTDADEKARQLMRGTVRDVFTESANFAAYQLEGRLGAAVDFHLYDAKTVDRLMRTNPQMLPEWKINEKKDYTWNEERVRSTLTRAIIQGKPIPDIADELGQQLATSNGDKMVLFARTAMTGAQNAGRIERLHDTQQMGIRVKKKWLAAHDARVRDTHAYLDGQERDVDDDFTVGDMHIAYPGDPLAPPELVYNCRCTMIYVYPEHQAEHQGEKTESYEKWLEEKKGKREEEPQEDAADIKSQEPVAVQEEQKQEAPVYSDDEKAAVEAYASGETMWINQYLRDPTDFGALSSNEMEMLAALDSATTKAVVQDKKLYRSVDAQAVFGRMSDIEFENLRGAIVYGDHSAPAAKALERAKRAIGTEITEKGFMSTTRDSSVAYEWGDYTGSTKGIVLDFNVSDGVRGFDVSHFFEVDEEEQQEVLLERGLTYRIDGIEKRETEDGGIVIVVLATIIVK